MTSNLINIDWSSIDNIFVDMDGTILDLAFDNFFWLEAVPKKYANQNRITLEESKAILFPNFKSKEGYLEWYSIDYWSEELQLDIYSIKWEYKNRIKYLYRAKDFLKICKDMNKNIFLVTNAHPRTLEIKNHMTSIELMVDRSISSFDYSFPKENIEFWNSLNKDTYFDPSRTIFIDDNEAMLKSAKNFGIRNLLGIRTPDSGKPANHILNFNSVDGLYEIIDKYI